MSVSHWTIAVGVSLYFLDQHLPIVLMGWLLGGFWSCSAGLAIHEASHGLVLQGRWGSFLAGVIAECPHFVPAYKPFRHYHMPHHSYISIDLGEKNGSSKNDNKKLPKYDPDLPTKFEAFLFSKNFLTRIMFLSLQALLYAFRPMIESPRSFVLEDYLAIVIQSCYVGSAYYVGGVGTVIYLVCAAIMG